MYVGVVVLFVVVWLICLVFVVVVFCLRDDLCWFCCVCCFDCVVFVVCLLLRCVCRQYCLLCVQFHCRWSSRIVVCVDDVDVIVCVVSVRCANVGRLLLCFDSFRLCCGVC